MKTHLIKPGLVGSLAMRCGLRVTEATDEDLLGTECGIGSIDCAGCLRGLLDEMGSPSTFEDLDCAGLRTIIVDMRIAKMGADTAEGRWLAAGDTGVSSITIWSVMMGQPMPDHMRPSVPHDPGDFGRCHQLLEEFPAWRARMPEVAARWPEWSGLVQAWGELTALYTEELPTGRGPRTWARMKEIEES